MMDERTLQERNKILSELAMIIYIFAVAAFVVKTVFLERGLGDCAVEYAIIILAPLYQYVRARQLKVSFYQQNAYSKSQRRKRNIISLITGAAIFALCFWRVKPDIGEVLPGLVIFAVVFYITRVAVAAIERKRAGRLEQEYEDNETED